MKEALNERQYFAIILALAELSKKNLQTAIALSLSAFPSSS